MFVFEFYGRHWISSTTYNSKKMSYRNSFRMRGQESGAAGAFEAPEETGAGIHKRQRPSSAPVIIAAATLECATARTGASAWPLPWPSASSAWRSAFRLSQLHNEPERSSG